MNTCSIMPPYHHSEINTYMTPPPPTIFYVLCCYMPSDVMY